MIFGTLHVALGLALLSAGPLLGGAAWLLCWPGASALLVGGGYLGLGPGVFGKRAPDGRLWPWTLSGALTWPYAVCAWTLWQLRCRLSSERAFDEVAPGILVGRRPLGPTEVPCGVRVVVDLTSEMPRAAGFAAAERYLCVPALDTSVPDDAALIALVEAITDEPGPILLHCAMGHGRSATVAAALLIRRGLARDVDEAVRLLRSKRHGVHLHPNQRAAVERVTCSAVPSHRHDAPKDRLDRTPGAA